MKKKKDFVSQCTSEVLYVTRYTGSGAVNTIVGFAVIFLAMAVGFTPVISNIAGFAVGFTLGFVLSKKFVFRSDGHFVGESVRYLIAFVVSFLFNLLVLHLALNQFKISPVPAQIVAALSYTIVMYILARFFVFSPTKNAKKVMDDVH